MIIDEYDHICMSMSEFHCDLNFVEFFWDKIRVPGNIAHIEGSPSPLP